MSVQGVVEFATDPAWQVTVLTGCRWSVAERSFEHAGHSWLIGLTPAAEFVALIVWRDGAVVVHARGSEAAMCTAALKFIENIFHDVEADEGRRG
jgi:hypothetical protein